jgi:hypothetical protein
VKKVSVRVLLLQAVWLRCYSVVARFGLAVDLRWPTSLAADLQVVGIAPTIRARMETLFLRSSRSRRQSSWRHVPLR